MGPLIAVATVEAVVGAVVGGVVVGVSSRILTKT